MSSNGQPVGVIWPTNSDIDKAECVRQIAAMAAERGCGEDSAVMALAIGYAAAAKEAAMALIIWLAKGGDRIKALRMLDTVLAEARPIRTDAASSLLIGAVSRAGVRLASPEVLRQAGVTP